MVQVSLPIRGTQFEDLKTSRFLFPFNKIRRILSLLTNQLLMLNIEFVL